MEWHFIKGAVLIRVLTPLRYDQPSDWPFQRFLALPCSFLDWKFVSDTTRLHRAPRTSFVTALRRYGIRYLVLGIFEQPGWWCGAAE